ncbi:MAG: Na+/H+ antiporter NhaC family protein [Myxococcota bacterium]
MLPAFVAIVLALVTRQALPSLLAGVVIGAGLLEQNLVSAFFVALGILADVLADADKTKIVLFTLLMGGMVGVLSASGGAAGLAGVLVKRAKTPRGARLTASALGLLFFFDDYASSLMVGTTMRPVTDRLQISREKLAYIVDSTSAPVASLALVSTWVGYEVSVMQDALTASGIQRGAYEVFLSGIPARFYPWLSLCLVFLVAYTGRDFGPMARAEERAFETGQVIRPGASPLMDVDGAFLSTDAKPRFWLGLVPIVVLMVTVLGVLASTGWSGASADPDALRAAFEEGITRGVGLVLGAASSYDALLYGSGLAALVAVVASATAGACPWSAGVSALMNGMKATLPAVVVLVLAWGVGHVMNGLQAGAFMATILGDTLPSWSLPGLVFLLSAALAFATGTSWGTMAIVFPVMMPVIATRMAEPAFESVLVGSTASVLAGAVFGDHCSPISDTTVLSSVACASDHADHTRTQAPYAGLAAGVALAACVAMGWGMPAWLGLGLGTAALATVFLRWSRRSGARSS